MHKLEYLTLLLSERIRHETGNNELADAARTLASASHEYNSPGNEDALAAMHKEWQRRFDKLMRR